MNLIFRLRRLFAAMTFLAGPMGLACPVPAREPPSLQSAPARANAGYFNLPLYFEANHGQTDASVKFFTRAAGYNLYLTAAQAVMVLPKAAAAKTEGPVVVRMKLRGANASPSIQGRDILPGHSSYLLGNDPSKWRVGVEQYAKVKFGQVYPGIDMVYYGRQGHVEHDFVVAPGADPGRILIGFEGGKGLRLDAQGNLILSVEGGEVTYQAPTLYQMRGGKRAPVPGRFVLAGENQVRFDVGDYNKSRELVIDPQLVYSSYLGGSVDDKAYAIAVDASGNVYLTGSTVSTDFPGVGGSTQSANGGGASDVFVTKISAAGTLAWSTYLGGTGIDIGLGIAVDGAGKVHITGSTTGGFPITASSGTLAGTDAFVAAISPNGTTVIYSVVFGGAGGEESGNGIAVDAAGNAYVTGHTTSASFPVTAGAAQLANGGADDAFVAKFDAAGALVYATYLGGTNSDHGNAIAVDGDGNAYVTGQCEPAFLPITATAFEPTSTGASDAFITKLNPAGSAFLYSTYVGGSTLDEGTGIALDSSTNVYITGWTDSTDFPGPGAVYAPMRVGSAQPAKGSGVDAFVFKLNIAGGGILDGVYSTYLGASGDDTATAIAVDSLGNAYVTGHTAATDFPIVGPVSGRGAGGEAFVTQISSTGKSFGFSSYLGGATDEEGQGIALDSANDIYVTGWTNSIDFSTANAFQPAKAGSYDAFITKISPAAGIAPPTTPAIFSVGLSSVGVSYGTVGADGYQVQASAAVDFTGTLYSSSTLAQATRLAPQGLDANTTYYLRAGALWNATTIYAAAVLSTSTLSDPVSATQIGGVWVTSITVNWAPLPLSPNRETAEGYVLEISTMPSFAPLWAASSVTTDVALSTLTIANLIGGKDYYFRVGSLNWNWVADYADPVSIALPVVLSLSLAPTTYAFGGIAVAASTNSWTSLVLSNEGNVDVDFAIQAAVVTPVNPWTIGAAPAFDTLLLRAVFNDGRPALADYGVEDLVTGVSALSQTAAQGGRYTVNDAQTGVAVPAGAQRQFWLRLDMPTTMTSARPQTLKFTVQASQH